MASCQWNLGTWVFERAWWSYLQWSNVWWRRRPILCISRNYTYNHHGNFVSHPCWQLDSVTGKFICRFSTKGCVLTKQMWLWPWNFHHRLTSKLSNLMAISTDPIPPSSWGLKNSLPGSNKIRFGEPNFVGFSKSYIITFLTLLKNTSTSPQWQKTSTGVGQPSASH